jgi:anthranilate phosphoribosyltransferase
MKHAGPVRRELAVPSVMNLLGPLANPAGVRRQLIGVADRERAPLVAGALAALGADHALVVHGRIGMDEIAPQGTSDVWEVRDGAVTHWELDPARYGLAIGDLGPLAGGLPAANAVRIERLLEDGAADTAGLAALLLNAGGALYVAGLADSYGDGVAAARDVVRSGKARAALERLRRASPSTSE